MITSRRSLLSGVGLLLATGWNASTRRARADELSPHEIIARADDVRNPNESYLLRLELDQNEGDPWELEVYSRSNRECLVRTLSPPRERGRALLMTDENMWAYLPNLKRSVRVALGQRLVGQAANGDITRTRWASDYAARVEADADQEWRLFLVANRKGLTYEKMRVWVEKGTFRPLHAECLSLTDHPLKTLAYGKYKELCGKVRPSEIVIADVVRPSETSVIRLLAMELRNFPEAMFTPESLQ